MGRGTEEEGGVRKSTGPPRKTEEGEEEGLW